MKITIALIRIIIKKKIESEIYFYIIHNPQDQDQDQEINNDMAFNSHQYTTNPVPSHYYKNGSEPFVYESKEGTKIIVKCEGKRSKMRDREVKQMMNMTHQIEKKGSIKEKMLERLEKRKLLKQ